MIASLSCVDIIVAVSGTLTLYISHVAVYSHTHVGQDRYQIRGVLAIECVIILV
jgi:hypothetical protein